MKNSLLFGLLLSSVFSFAQEFTMDLAQDLKPRNIGPAGMSGRVTAIDVVTEDPDIIYAGTASGGLWKSTSGGTTWTPIFDNESTASIGAVAIDPSNASVVWVGTGEGNPRNSLNGGYGVFRSLDAGKTWTSMGLEKTRHIHRILIDPNDSNTVYVGAIGSPWGAHKERGVYKTTDGGKTWKQVLFTNTLSGVGDMVMDPKNPNKLLVGMWEHKRDPWFFKSGGPGSGLFLTYDGGETWKKLSDKEGLPEGELGRIGLAIAPSNTNVIYALVEAKKNALYRSSDGGEKWEKVNDKEEIGNRPFYYSDIAVDPSNENRIYSVFTYVNVSEDGGKSFKELMPAYNVSNGVHPDHHAWYIHPNDPDFMINGNDGGLNITRDRGKSWRFADNIPVGQFYHVAVDNEFPYNVYGGMQDNGSWRGPAYVWKAQGIRNSYWQEISFGDGFDVVPDPDDSRYGYSMSQQGNVVRYDYLTGNNYGVRPTPPDETTELRFNWNSGIGQDPFDSSTVYFGSQFVHKSTDKGLTWSVISPDLTTNDPEKQKQSESGGLTMDATGAENHCTILVIEPSKAEKNFLWVGTDDGRVHYTKDGGNQWTEVTSNLKGLPKGSWIAQIKASETTPGEAFLIANDYRRFNYTPYAYHTTNYGKSWERIVDESDVSSYTLSIIQDPEHPNLLFLGTDDGLYLSLDKGKKWTKYTNGFPTVSTKDLLIHPREKDLVIGTFGRALWVLDDIRPLQQLSSRPDLLDSEIVVFDAPTAYHAAYQQPTGSRFGADALFNGENRPSGGRISYYIKQGAEGMKTKDSIHLFVLKESDTIRHLKIKRPEKPGIHRTSWRLDEKGVANPSRNLRKSSREPSGADVLPGTYTLIAQIGDHVSQASIAVELDPRLNASIEDAKAVYQATKSLGNLTAELTASTNRLAKANAQLKTFEAQLKANETNLEDEAKEALKTIKSEITNLQDKVFGKEDKRQGITRNPEMTVLTRIRNASRYVQSRKTGITATEEQLIDYAEKAVKAYTQEVTAFFDAQWKGFVERMSPLQEPVLSSID